MMPLAVILLVIALVAIYAWRKFGDSAPSSPNQLHHPDAGDDAAFLTYIAASQADHHSPGDGSDHGADVSDSSDAGDGGADGGSD